MIWALIYFTLGFAGTYFARDYVLRQMRKEGEFAIADRIEGSSSIWAFVMFVMGVIWLPALISSKIKPSKQGR